jgi:hypothetical protein
VRHLVFVFAFGPGLGPPGVHRFGEGEEGVEKPNEKLGAENIECVSCVSV